MEDVKFCEIRDSPLEFNSRKNCQHFMNWMSCNWDKRDKVWCGANSLFKWRFRNRRRHCCLSSLLASFFFAFLLTLTTSRSKQLQKKKGPWLMSSHLDFTLGQKPLFLFFPSSSYLHFFSFWQRCLNSGWVFWICWACTSSWAVG